jgi:hypothetical protein
MNAKHNPDDGIVVQSLKDIFCTIIDYFNAGLCYVTGEFSAKYPVAPIVRIFFLHVMCFR